MSPQLVQVVAAVVGVLVVSNAAPAQNWAVLEQPELAQQLAQAPPLEYEELGHACVSVHPCGTTLAPSGDGKSYTIMQWYQKAYYRDTRVYLVDQASGAVKLQQFPDPERGRRERMERAFVWSNVLGEDGRRYGSTPDYGKHHAGGSMSIYTYDPEAREVKLFAEVPGLGGETHPFVLGPDGRFYGAGTYLVDGSHQYSAAYWLDPKTKEHRHDEQQGLLYGVDIRRGQVLFNRPLPRTLRLNWSHTSLHPPNFVLGPDGLVWTMLADVLVRIDPQTTQVHVVGRLKDGPAHFVFQGRDLYLAGGEHLRRVRDLAAPR